MLEKVWRDKVETTPEASTAWRICSSSLMTISSVKVGVFPPLPLAASLVIGAATPGVPIVSGDAGGATAYGLKHNKLFES